MTEEQINEPTPADTSNSYFKIAVPIQQRNKPLPWKDVLETVHSLYYHATQRAWDNEYPLQTDYYALRSHITREIIGEYYIESEES